MGRSSLDTQRARMVGYWLGDGVLREPSLTFMASKPEIVEDYCAILEHMGLTPSVTEPSSGNFRIRTPRAGKRPSVLKEFAKDLGIWGCTAYTKFIPEEFFDAPRDVRISLLMGLWDTDGCLYENKKRGDLQMIFTTTSETLARDVERLLIGLGWAPRVYSRERRTSFGDTHFFEVKLSSQRQVHDYLAGRKEITDG